MGFASRRFAAPLVLALFLTGAQPADRAALDRIAAYAGHPATLHLRATRTLVVDNRTTLETLDAQGAKRLVRTCRDGLCHGIWNDGHTVRPFGINGVPLPDDDLDAARERTAAAIDTTAFAEPDFAGTVAPLPPAGGQNRWLVHVSGGSPLVAWTDENGAIRGIGGPEERIPAPVYAAATPGGAILYARVALASAERLDGPLEAPPGARTITGASLQLPLSGPLPIVPCHIDGRPARCLLDTGTTPSGVTLDFAERLGAEPHGEITIAALGTYVTGTIDQRTIALGNATIGPLSLAVIPTAQGIGFDAILGTDALAGLRLTFDSKTRTVEIGAPGGPLEGALVPLRFTGDGVPLVNADIGDLPQALLFDTGDNGLLSIGFDTYLKHVDLFAPGPNVPVEGLAGTAAALAGTIAHARIGGLTLGPAAIRAVRGEHLGHIGFGLAARCAKLVVDISQGELSCTPR